MDTRATRQLEGLAEVVRILEELDLDYRLFGGWAVDFYVGSVGRVHDDIDFAVWLADHAQIAGALAEAGWRHAPHPDDDGGTGYERDGIRVEFTFLVKDGADVLLPLRAGPVVWPYEHGDDVRMLAGVAARLVSRRSLVAGKLFQRADPEDRVKDSVDLAALGRAQET